MIFVIFIGRKIGKKLAYLRIGEGGNKVFGFKLFDIQLIIIAMLLVVGACQCGKSTALRCASQMVGLKPYGTGKSKSSFSLAFLPSVKFFGFCAKNGLTR